LSVVGLIDLGPITLLSPVAGLIALAAAVPIVMLGQALQRARVVRERLQLPEPAHGRRQLVLAVVSLAVLVGLAATQPVWAQSHTQRIRKDAEAYIVFDISRSMLASVGPSGETRLDRAKKEALGLRAQLPEIPVGIASMTDRTLPHLFPSPDQNAFRATVAQAINIEQPPPIAQFRTVGTTLAALSTVPLRGFFSPSATKRVMIVYTDGESRKFDIGGLAVVLRRAPSIRPVFVHTWDAHELVYSGAGAEPDYRPRAGSSEVLQRTAKAAGGTAFEEQDAGRAASVAREYLGSGPTIAERQSQDELSMGPFVLALAALPLLYLLLRLSR
jgi:hypothetical protein